LKKITIINPNIFDISPLLKMTTLTNFNSFTTRDLIKVTVDAKANIDTTANELKSNKTRADELAALIRQHQDELGKLIPVIKSQKKVLDKKKKTYAVAVEVLSQRKHASEKEKYADRCREYILVNAELATHRVTDSGTLNCEYDTRKFELPDLTCSDDSDDDSELDLSEQKNHLDTLTDDDIIAFAQLLHLCKAFDDAECESFDDTYVVKLDDFEIENHDIFRIRFSEKYGCYGQPDEDDYCCHKRFAYTACIDADDPSELTKYNDNFSIDVVVEESFGRV
jgi:hypothetical protein